jgi:hypothetical protein
VEYGGTGELLTYTDEADFVFGTTASKTLYLNLTSTQFGGDIFSNGTDTLTFKYDLDNSGWTTESFTTLSAAEAFFSNPVDLGVSGTGMQTLDLEFIAALSGDPPNFEIFVDLSQTPFSPSVPEPSTWAMLMMGFGGLGWAGLRRSRRRSAIG